MWRPAGIAAFLTLAMAGTAAGERDPAFGEDDL